METMTAQSQGEKRIGEEHARELWVSLASLLRSYTAAYGLNGDTQAAVELSEGKILVRCGERWLSLRREGDAVQTRTHLGEMSRMRWNEEGELETEAGGRVPMDLQAEEWSRELVG